MGLRLYLLLFPVAILAVSIIIQAGAFTSSGGAQVNFQGGGQASGTVPTTYKCTSPKYACFPGGTLPQNSIVTCASQAVNGIIGPCDLWDNCNNVPQGAYCVYAVFIFPLYTALDNGVTLYVGSSGQVTQSTQSSAAFGFGAIGVTGLIIMVTVAVSVAALAGISVFGSGENAESVHILFIGGLLIGLWLILSTAEGFVTGAPASIFVKINVAAAGYGTMLYVLLTLLYMVGITGTVSRGGV